MSTFIEDQDAKAKEVFTDVKPSIRTKMKLFALEEDLPELIAQRGSNIKYVHDMSKIPPIDRIPPGIIFVSNPLGPSYMNGYPEKREGFTIPLL